MTAPGVAHFLYRFSLSTPPALALVVVLGVFAPFAGCSAAPDLFVADAVVRPPLPGKTTSVAYFNITSHASNPAVLVGAESPIADVVEMHTHLHDGDMMRMRRVEQITIAPGAKVRFESGGYHLMLFGVHDLQQHLKQQQLPITLQFKERKPLRVMFSLEDY